MHVAVVVVVARMYSKTLITRLGLKGGRTDGARAVGVEWVCSSQSASSSLLLLLLLIACVLICKNCMTVEESAGKLQMLIAACSVLNLAFVNDILIWILY